MFKYGVYCEKTNRTIYRVFSSDVFEEAERKGFVKVRETETEMEAIQEARRFNLSFRYTKWNDTLYRSQERIVDPFH